MHVSDKSAGEVGNDKAALTLVGLLAVALASLSFHMVISSNRYFSSSRNTYSSVAGSAQ